MASHTFRRPFDYSRYQRPRWLGPHHSIPDDEWTRVQADTTIWTNVDPASGTWTEV